jgi:hypothetical protein
VPTDWAAMHESSGPAAIAGWPPIGAAACDECALNGTCQQGRLCPYRQPADISCVTMRWLVAGVMMFWVGVFAAVMWWPK